MKIEKVNDHQIRCTLTKNDLADRELKISELAYGTEKAKSLFRDMMQQAAYQFGFEADDIPLMIEAIPLNSDCIVLIITKVEDPEELDTRFSNFAPNVSDEEDIDDEEYDSLDDIGDTMEPEDDPNGDVLDLFRKLHEQTSEKEAEKEVSKEVSAKPLKEAGGNISRIFSFHSLNDLTRVASVLNKFYKGSNALYKNSTNGQYMLVVCRDRHTPNEFNKVCNTLSEYGYLERNGCASVEYLEEHYEAVIAHDAIHALSQIF